MAAEAIRFRLTLAYVGTRYGGWQRQPNSTTVQEVVENALADLLGEPITVTGAGRTDAGVHARGQVAHFDLEREFPLSGLVHGTNHRLPDDVRVVEAAVTPSGFHARYSAEAKEYRYRFLRSRAVDPQAAPAGWSVPEAFDLAALSAAMLHLPGRHDFAAFALAGGAHTKSVRTIHQATLRDEAPALELRLVGDGFLRGMVRAIAGTLVEVALGRLTVSSFASLLAGADRGAAGPTAPPHALTLERVWYRSAGAPRRPPGADSEIAVVTSIE